MPTYLYRDVRGHMRTVVHSMTNPPKVICKCGMDMWRVPQLTRVNWNGNKAVGGTSPVVQKMIDEAPRKRDEFAKVKDEHDRRTRAEKKRLRESDPTYGTVHRKRK